MNAFEYMSTSCNRVHNTQGPRIPWKLIKWVIIDIVIL